MTNSISPPSFSENTESFIILNYEDADGDVASVCTVSNPVNILVTSPCSCASGDCIVGVTGTTDYTGAAFRHYPLCNKSITIVVS